METNNCTIMRGSWQDSIERKTVAIGPEHEFRGRRRLFELLAELYPVNFVPWSPDAPALCDGVILWDATAEAIAAVSTQGLNCLAVSKAEGPMIAVKRGAVEFGKTGLLDTCFRGQTMTEEGIGEFSALPIRKDDETVCSLESQPYWLVRHVGSVPASIVALGPEEMPERTTVYEHFNRRFWLRLLPFFHFLKRLTQDVDWSPPPLRACLMFDDPNLHSETYGFIDFAKLARHARESNYHVSFAMVPLDAWFVHSDAATLFRQNQTHLSLLMHGNNHAKTEFGLALDADTYARSLAQAIRRIDRFEQRSGVSVARVMAPPYGAFREIVADVMTNLGYEAACVSRASLASWNKENNWPSTFGHSVAEFVGAGAPIIPRQVMARGHAGSYRLAAFLNQPIIPHGHHQDCAGGLDLLVHVANEINSLGEVIWSDMTSISRSNYLTRRVGETLFVKMLSRRITLPLDGTVEEIVIERPWIAPDADPEPLVCQQGGRISFANRSGRQSLISISESKGTVELIAPSINAINPRSVCSPGVRVGTVARRLLAETRDRVAPFATRIRRQRKAASADGQTGNGHS
jgi:hypothetical protein